MVELRDIIKPILIEFMVRKMSIRACLSFSQSAGHVFEKQKRK